MKLPFSQFFAKSKPAPPQNDWGKMLVGNSLPRWGSLLARDYTPERIEMILRGAFNGNPENEQELYRIMSETWPRLVKNITEIKDSVLGLDFSVNEPEGALPNSKDLVEKARTAFRPDVTKSGLGWRELLSSLLDARFIGVSILEIEWQQNGFILPRQCREVATDQFGWHRGKEGDPHNGHLRLYPNGKNEKSEEFAKNKFLIGISRSGRNHSSAGALLRPLAWFWMSANFSRDWLLRFAQLFGQPIRMATYALNASEETKNDIANMMERVGSCAWGLIPEGSDLKLLESSQNGRDNPQAYVMKLADAACDLLILGQTLTSDVGASGSRALGEVHQSVRSDRIDAAAAWLCEILNFQLIPSLLRLNYGDNLDDATFPFFISSQKSKRDTLITAQAIKLLLDAGVPLLRAQVYDLMDLTEPKKGDEVLGGSPKTPTPTNPPTAQGGANPQATLAPLLGKLPFEAREYLMARMAQEETSEEEKKPQAAS